MFKIIKKLLDPMNGIKSDLIIKENGHSYIRVANSFESALRPALVVPFYGTEQTVVLRRLTGAQRRACGDFSLIQTMTDIIEGKSRKVSFKKRCDYSKLQYDVIKKALVSPTYEEIMALNEYDILRLDAEKQVKELEPIINGLPAGVKKEKLKEEYYMQVMNMQYLLPEDFISHIFSYALGIDGSDLHEITEDMLYESAILAKNSGGRPSTYMPGSFKDHHLVDIDKRSWCEYYKREEKKKRNK